MKQTFLTPTREVLVRAATTANHCYTRFTDRFPLSLQDRSLGTQPDYQYTSTPSTFLCVLRKLKIFVNPTHIRIIKHVKIQVPEKEADRSTIPNFQTIFIPIQSRDVSFA